MGVRALLVDDDPAILQTFSAILALEGVEVVGAASAAEAMDKIHAAPFDLVITDMHMESPDAGREVMREALNVSVRPVLVILSAFPLASRELCSEGASSVWLKGGNLNALLQELRAIIGTIEGAKPKSENDSRGDLPPARCA